MVQSVNNPCDTHRPDGSAFPNWLESARGAAGAGIRAGTGWAKPAVTAGRVDHAFSSDGDGWDGPRVRDPAQIIRLGPTSPDEAGLDGSP